MKGCYWVLGIGAGLLVLLFIVGIVNAPDGQQDGATLADLDAKIGPDAVIEMEAADYRDTFNGIGEEAFERANELAKWPAITAAASPRCDTVEIAAISEQATSEELQWFVECTNGERFRISEAEAVATRDSFENMEGEGAATVAAPAPESAVFDNLSEADVVSRCDIAVQSAMRSQGSFDTAWQWDFTRHPSTGRVTVVRDFEADNAFGATLSSQYECVVNAADMELVSLRIREGNGWQTLYSE